MAIKQNKTKNHKMCSIRCSESGVIEMERNPPVESAFAAWCLLYEPILIKCFLVCEFFISCLNLLQLTDKSVITSTTGASAGASDLIKSSLSPNRAQDICFYSVIEEMGRDCKVNDMTFSVNLRGRQTLAVKEANT